jgi:putative hemolysin
MKGELLILFVILLLGLILCSFLGGKGCVEGMENGSSQVFYGPNGATAQIKTDSSGQKNLVITNSDGTTTNYNTTDSSATTYSGPNGGTAKVISGSDGSKSLIVQKPDGSVHTYKLSDTSASTSSSTSTSTSSSTSNSASSNNYNSYDNYNHYSGTSYPTIFYGPNGGTARVIKTQNNNTIVITNKNGTTEIYYIDSNSNDPNISTYYGQNGGSAKLITDSNGKQAVEITTPNGSKIVYTGDNAYTYNSQDGTINQYDPTNVTTGSDYNTAYSASTYTGPYGGQATTVTGPAGNTYSTYDSSAYYNSLPQGIPRSQIPPGDEDLYILKSQVVPPVCPKCPDPIVQCPENNDVTKCPPCPPCARCPEPAFDCKKVPNYNAFNQSFMPVPVLNDFSTFGM